MEFINVAYCINLSFTVCVGLLSYKQIVVKNVDVVSGSMLKSIFLQEHCVYFYVIRIMKLYLKHKKIEKVTFKKYISYLLY